MVCVRPCWRVFLHGCGRWCSWETSSSQICPACDWTAAEGNSDAGGATTAAAAVEAAVVPEVSMEAPVTWKTSRRTATISATPIHCVKKIRTAPICKRVSHTKPPLCFLCYYIYQIHRSGTLPADECLVVFTWNGAGYIFPVVGDQRHEPTPCLLLKGAENVYDVYVWKERQEFIALLLGFVGKFKDSSQLEETIVFFFLQGEKKASSFFLLKRKGVRCQTLYQADAIVFLF